MEEIKIKAYTFDELMLWAQRKATENFITTDHYRIQCRKNIIKFMEDNDNFLEEFPDFLDSLKDEDYQEFLCQEYSKENHVLYTCTGIPVSNFY